MPRRRSTSPRKQPIQKRSRGTVAALLDGAARVLTQDGYDRASTNRIAEAAGVSVGSLYQYFPSKEALVAALVDREVELQFRVVTEKLGEVADAPLAVGVRRLVEAVIAAHRVHPKLHRVLTEEIPRVGALKRVVEMQALTTELLESALRARKSEIRPQNFSLVAFLLVYAVEGVVHGAVNYHSKLIEDENLVSELTDLLVRYLT